MTSGTRETVEHPEDESWYYNKKCSRIGGCQLAWKISTHTHCTVCGMNSDGTFTPSTPPPLQPGDAVWVRAVYVRGEGLYSLVEVGNNDLHWLESSQIIRRIEGEVKP